MDGPRGNWEQKAYPRLVSKLVVMQEVAGTIVLLFVTECDS